MERTASSGSRLGNMAKTYAQAEETTAQNLYGEHVSFGPLDMVMAFCAGGLLFIVVGLVVLLLWSRKVHQTRASIPPHAKMTATNIDGNCPRPRRPSSIIDEVIQTAYAMEEGNKHSHLARVSLKTNCQVAKDAKAWTPTEQRRISIASGSGNGAIGHVQRRRSLVAGAWQWPDRTREAQQSPLSQ